jgi:hypothetical protein
MELNLKDLVPGIYFIKATDSEGAKLESKIIKID